MGVSEQDVPPLLQGIPASDPHPFGGQFSAVFQREIDCRKQAEEMAKQFAPRHRLSNSAKKAKRRASSTARQQPQLVTVTFPRPLRLRLVLIPVVVGAPREDGVGVAGRKVVARALSVSGLT